MGRRAGTADARDCVREARPGSPHAVGPTVRRRGKGAPAETDGSVAVGSGDRCGTEGGQARREARRVALGALRHQGRTTRGASAARTSLPPVIRPLRPASRGPRSQEGPVRAERGRGDPSPPPPQPPHSVDPRGPSRRHWGWGDRETDRPGGSDRPFAGRLAGCPPCGHRPGQTSPGCGPAAL